MFRSNAGSGQNTMFGKGVTTANVLELAVNEAMVLIITFGQINKRSLTPQNRQTSKVVLQQETIQELMPNIADAIVFGGIASHTDRHTFTLLDGDEGRKFIKKRDVDDNDYSYSRCSGTSSAPFLSSSFRDTIPSPGLPNHCEDIINVVLIDSFETLTNLDENTNDCNSIDYGKEYLHAAEQHLESTSSKDLRNSRQDCKRLGEDLSKTIGKTELAIDQKLSKKQKLIDPWTDYNPQADIPIKR